MFVYLLSLSNDGFISRPNGSGISPIRLDTTGGQYRLNVSSDGSSFGLNATNWGTPSANTWQHIALTRSGNVWRLFLDGTQSGTTTNSITPFASTDSMIIGARTTAANFIDGYIDELRITKGIARYTANFTPPTAPFPDA
jgi:hypothetical protein